MVLTEYIGGARVRMHMPAQSWASLSHPTLNEKSASANHNVSHSTHPESGRLDGIWMTRSQPRCVAVRSTVQSYMK